MTRQARCFLSALTCLSLLAAPALAQDKPAGPDKPPESNLLTQADAIAREVALMRGLSLKSPMQKGVRDRKQLRETLVRRIAEEYTDEEIAAEGKLYKQLGLFPQDLDYKALILDLLTEQIAGFYDQNSKELYIMSGLPAALQRPTMAHEIFHVLQDQHFDILAMQAPFDPKANGDFQLARSALLEGDATLLMIDFTLKENAQLPQGAITSLAQMPLVLGAVSVLTLENLTSIQSILGGSEPERDPTPGARESASDRAPAVLKESLIFPYVAGLRFILMAYSKLGSWEAMRAIYADAPVSTEQIIHPERYFAKDLPTLLEFDPGSALPGKTWTPIYENVAGEFQMYLTLKQHLRIDRKQGAPLPAIDLPIAVEGWGGDKLLAFENADEDVLIAHMSSWDTLQDAAEYYEAINGALTRRFHGQPLRIQTSAAGHGESTCYTLGEGEDAQRIYIERWGDLVLHLEGVPHTPMPEGKHKDALVFSLRDASFGSLKRTDFLPTYRANLKLWQETRQLKKPGQKKPE